MTTPPMETLTEFDSRTDALWARVEPTFEFAVVRDQQYIAPAAQLARRCDERAGPTLVVWTGPRHRGGRAGRFAVGVPDALWRRP